jgi:hypothetical protein
VSRDLAGLVISYIVIDRFFEKPGGFNIIKKLSFSLSKKYVIIKQIGISSPRKEGVL